MLVAHRNMISVFDMSKGIWEEASWIDTIHFEEGYVRKMFIKKRSKKERLEIMLEKLNFKDGGDYGDRGEEMDDLIRQML